jgi:hypothetical protein
VRKPILLFLTPNFDLIVPVEIDRALRQVHGFPRFAWWFGPAERGLQPQAPYAKAAENCMKGCARAATRSRLDWIPGSPYTPFAWNSQKKDDQLVDIQQDLFFNFDFAGPNRVPKRRSTERVSCQGRLCPPMMALCPL